MNTRFLEAEYDYVKPETLEEALCFLNEHENTKIFAGGTDLIVKMKMGAHTDMKYMLDINGIEALKQVKKDAEGRLVIGSTIKLSHLAKLDLIRNEYPVMAKAIADMASVSIRNMGTIGGNFCNASPVADTAGPSICHHGLVEVKSVNGTRYIPAEEFFLRPGVSLIAENEILTAVILPAPEANTGSDFIKYARVASDIAKLSITVVLVRDGDKIKECRIAMGAVAAKPILLEEISAGLSGKVMSAELIHETAVALSETIKPITDTRSTAEYRKDATIIIAEEALNNAWTRSGGKSL